MESCLFLDIWEVEVRGRICVLPALFSFFWICGWMPLFFFFFFFFFRGSSLRPFLTFSISKVQSHDPVS